MHTANLQLEVAEKAYADDTEHTRDQSGDQDSQS
jgi:hypothetical protein